VPAASAAPEPDDAPFDPPPPPQAPAAPQIASAQAILRNAALASDCMDSDRHMD